MRIELEENDRTKLSELYLRRSLAAQEINRLQQLVQDLTLQIQSEQLRITKERFKDPREEEIKAMFQDYQLVGLEVPDDWEEVEQE